MGLFRGAQPFERGNLPPLDKADRQAAGTRGLTVDQHGAGAALTQTAAVFGSVEGEIVAKNEEKGRRWVQRQPVVRAIDVQP
ncbi:hypothetical protein Acid7E03_13300 [Acidisoma sp. 7E03]